jgi:hypothetical protein
VFEVEHRVEHQLTLRRHPQTPLAQRVPQRGIHTAMVGLPSVQQPRTAQDATSGLLQLLCLFRVGGRSLGSRLSGGLDRLFQRRRR